MNNSVNLLEYGRRLATGKSVLNGFENRLVNPNGCTVMLCTSGYASVVVNLRKQIFRQGDVVFLFGSSTFSLVRKSSAFKVAFVTCVEEVVEDTFCKISSSAFWDFICSNPIIRTDAQQKAYMDAWMKQAEWITERCIPDFQTTLLNGHIFSLCMAVDSEVRQYPDAVVNQYKDRVWVLLRKFSHLLSKHCIETREVNFYAEKLNISRDYLYKLTMQALGRTPKDVIEQQAVVEIKIYLAHTDLSVKNIANAMHFSDTSYMCRFFKRMTGMTPSEYRLR